MPLNDIVNVLITRQTQTVSELGFGTPLILGTSNAFTQRIKFYANMGEVSLDFNSSTPEYIAAQDVFAQNPRPQSLAIGRRQANNQTVSVITGMSGQAYTIILNNIPTTVNSTSSTTFSVVELSDDLVAGNRVNVAVNGTTLGTMVSVIDFDSDFVASNSIVSTVNGTPLSADVFTTDQAVTLAAVAAKLGTATGVASSVVTGARQITVTFTAPGANTVNSVVTTLGLTQPVATINEGGFGFSGSSAVTMQSIATAISSFLGAGFNAATSGINNRRITLSAPANTTVTVGTFLPSGAGAPTASISQEVQQTSPTTIAQNLVTAINANASLPVTATSVGANITLVNKTPGIAYTLEVGTDIVLSNNTLVRVTQVTPNSLYELTVNGQTFEYTSPPDIQDANEIIQSFVSQISLLAPGAPFTATNNNNGTLTLTSVVPSELFSTAVSPDIMSFQNGLTVVPVAPVESIQDSLDAITAESDDWYALILLDRTVATVLAAASWIETKVKIFGTASDDLTIVNTSAASDTTSIAAQLKQLGRVRTFVMYHQDAESDYPEAAWFGRVLPLTPGSENWAFKTLANISYSNLTSFQVKNALDKSANVYTFVGGVGITQYGTMAQGEYIDIIRGVDWLKARIQEFVFSVLVNNDKISYTDSGIAIIQAEVMRALALGVDNNFLSDNPLPLVTVPLAISVPPADKANRILRNVKFQATLAGAINIVFIQGTVSV